MTKAEAIAMLKRIQEPEAWEPQITQAAFEALDMAIEALDCSESPNSSDTISRQAAIRWVKTECNPYGNPTLDFESGKKVIKHLEQMPSAQPEPIKVSVDHEMTEEELKELKKKIADSPVALLPSAQPEQLTDKEQRIFLAAMGREEEVCKQVDEECKDCREPYEDSLVGVCREIIRKVKAALWET